MRLHFLRTAIAFAIWIPSSFLHGLGLQAGSLCLVELDGATSEAKLDALRSVGLEPLQYLPERTFIAFGSAASLRAAGGLAFVREAREFPLVQKLTPKLQSLSRAESSAESMASGPLDVIVQLFEVGDTKALRKFLAHAGGREIWVSRPGRRVHLRAVVPAHLLAGLARWPSVFRIEEMPEIQLKSERALVTSSGAFPAGDLCVVPGYEEWLERKGLRGQGMVVHLMDDGVERGDASGFEGTAHPDLIGALDGVDNATSDPEADSRAGHGSLNAGLIAGRAATGLRDFDGFRFGLGLAPASTVFATKIFNDLGRFETGPRSFADLIGKASQRGALISSNSWGASVFGAYDALSAEFDAMARDANAEAGLQPMTFIFAAGNEGDDVPFGTQSIGSPGTAKNVITVGASESCDSEARDGCGVGPLDSDSIRDVAQFSSRGPNADGRLGPMLVAPGTHTIGVASTAVGYDGAGLCDPFWPLGQVLYSRGSGTSHACPLVAGAATLFQEWYLARTGAAASPALLRAALAASTRDLAGGEDGNGGKLESVPSNAQGWGRLSMEDLLPDRGAAPRSIYFDEEVLLTDAGDSWETVAFPIEPGAPVRMALAWDDPPAVPGASPTLVNDLDLEVETSGKLYRGNVIRKGVSIPDGEPDRLNNLECVILDSPGPVLRIRVRATSINGDGAPAGDTTDQDFALVVSGGTLQSSRGVVSFRRNTYACDSFVGLMVSDLDLKGRPSVEVTVSSSAAAQPVVASLTEVTAGTGVFDGSIRLGKDPNQLLVADGSVLTARYLDANDGTGAAAESITTASADCTAPSITGVKVGELTESSAVISWSTSEDSTGKVRHGADCATVPVEILVPRRSKSHSVTLTGLSPGSRQFFTVSSTDAVGNTSSDDRAGSCYAFFTSSPVCGFQDAVEPTPLPGWTHGAAQGPDDWAPVVFRGAHSATHAWHSPGHDGFKDASLVTPPLEVEAGDRFTFWHTFQLEKGYDGAVLEISTNGGATWSDLGPFITRGGYSEVISGNPIGERMGWTGQRTEAMTQVEVDLSSWAGSSRLIRFRIGTDASFADGFGWHVDDVMVCRSLNKRASLFIQRDVYRCGDRLHVQMDDFDLVGKGTAEARISSTTRPDGVSLQLRETSPGNGVFAADVLLGTEPDGLPVTDGDEVTVSYFDADDGTGAEPVTLTDSAKIDCKAPQITSVRVLELLDDEATLSFETDEPAVTEVNAGPTCADLPIRVVSPMGGTSHVIRLGGLDAGASYRFKILASDEAGNVSVDDAGGECRRFQPASVCTSRFDFDDGAPGWTHSAALGKDTWRIEASPFARTGPDAWILSGFDEFADVALVSPPFFVPPGAWLGFWHTYELESTFDGGVIEASDDGGITWRDLGPQIRRGGYTSTLVAPNPLAGRRAWSGGSIGPLTRVIVDLSSWAGRSLQIRFRAVSDASVGGAGWIVDHVEVCQGVREEGRLGLDREAYRCEDRVRVQVLDTGRIDQTGAPVRISSDSEPAPEEILLAETAPGSGVFGGEVLLGAVDGPGTLLVKEGDTIHISYNDQDDGSGQAVESVASALIDCTAPRLGEITLVERTSSQVVVTWKTDEDAIGKFSVGSSCGDLSRVSTERMRTTEHRLESRGLPPGTLHFFRVEATDAAGNVSTEAPPEDCRSFRTLVRYAAFEETLEPTPREGWDDSARWRVIESPLATTPLHVWAIEGTGKKSDSSLTTPPFLAQPGGMLELWHSFGLATGLTGGVIEGSRDGGETWIDLEPDILEGRYTSFVLPGSALEGRRAWTGGQLGPMSRVRVSLRSLEGGEALVRFRWASQGIGDEGSWLIDDLRVTHDVGETAFVGFGGVAHSCAATANVLLADSNLAGASKALVMISSTSQPDPIQIELTEQTPGFFRGQVQLSPETAPGVVRVAHGDELKCALDDPAGENGQPVSVEGRVRIDCTPPVVSQVSVGGGGITTAEVRWETDEPARGRAEYGASCEAPGQFAPSASVKTSHSALLTGLDQGPDVFVRIRVKDVAGNENVPQACASFSITRTCGLEDALEPPADGWKHAASLGPDDWELKEFDLSHSPKRSFHGPNTGQPKDAVLVMPSVDLERGSVLSFWHTFEFEEGFDGAALQISVDQGASWTDLGPDIFEGRYTGTISTFGGPVAGWTGGTIGDMRKVSVSLERFTGPGRLVRFRILCDDSVGTPGWFLDDISVCTFAARPTAPGFARGNCNADGSINLTDAVFVLNYLFKGGSTPGCLRACDSDHNDAINLTDAVFLLDYLFRGGRPLDPPLGCDSDLTPGRVECVEPACIAR